MNPIIFLNGISVEFCLIEQKKDGNRPNAWQNAGNDPYRTGGKIWLGSARANDQHKLFQPRSQHKIEFDISPQNALGQKKG